MIGLPRSGKTTESQAWLQDRISKFKLIDVTMPRAVVTVDNIRLALGHRYNSYVEGFVDACKHTMIRTLLYEHDVLVDDTHTTEKSICELFDINIDATYTLMPPDIKLCKEGAESTNQKDLFPIIDRMFNSLCNLITQYVDTRFTSTNLNTQDIVTYFPMVIEKLKWKVRNIQHLKRIV